MIIIIIVITWQGPTFDQQFDPLVFENFSKFVTKRASMTVKE